MKRMITHALVKTAIVGFLAGTSAAAIAQQAPPNICHEDAVSQCNYGSWETKGYASEQQCVEDNSQYCNDGGGGSDGTGIYRDVQPRPCASRIPGNCL